jgi:hypothetical protein
MKKGAKLVGNKGSEPADFASISQVSVCATCICVCKQIHKFHQRMHGGQDENQKYINTCKAFRQRESAFYKHILQSHTRLKFNGECTGHQKHTRVRECIDCEEWTNSSVWMPAFIIESKTFCCLHVSRDTHLMAVIYEKPVSCALQPPCINQTLGQQ